MGNSYTSKGTREHTPEHPRPGCSMVSPVAPKQAPITTSSACRPTRRQRRKPWREPRCCAPSHRPIKPNRPTTTASVLAPPIKAFGTNSRALEQLLADAKGVLSIPRSHDRELRGVRGAAYQDGPVQDCHGKAEAEEHQRRLPLGPQTQHHLPRDSQEERRGKELQAGGAEWRRWWLHPGLVFQVSSVKYLAKSLSTFHQINAYEDDGFLVLDMCASDDGLAIANYNIQNLRKSGEALDEVSGETGAASGPVPAGLNTAASPAGLQHLVQGLPTALCSAPQCGLCHSLQPEPERPPQQHGHRDQNRPEQSEWKRAPPAPVTSTDPPASLCRCAALTRTSTGRTFTATEAWSSLRSTTGGTTRGPTATSMAAGSDTSLETRSSRWTWAANA